MYVDRPSAPSTPTNLEEYFKNTILDQSIYMIGSFNLLDLISQKQDVCNPTTIKKIVCKGVGERGYNTGTNFIAYDDKWKFTRK